MPERFDMDYIGADGEKHRPIMLHRVVFGSIERFIGILIEQFAGAFPLWLAPVQVEVIPVSERHLEYAAKVRDQMVAAGLRCELDTRNEKMGYKIREAQMMKIPYMLVVGDKEIENNSVAVRSRAGGDLGVMPARCLPGQGPGGDPLQGPGVGILNHRSDCCQALAAA